MEFEFDKEIDAILRRARSTEAVTSGGSHLDADEFAAFAENSVSEAARGRFVAHLADCTRCRKILSNVILLNSEAETETASSVVTPPVGEAKTPWYRRLFVFPQLAYTMGGLVLLFSGFFGYLLLKNLPGSQNSDVSFTTDNPVIEKPAPAANAPAANSNSAATTTNSSAPSISYAPSNSSATSNSASNPAPLSASNTTTDATPAQTERSTDKELNSPVAVPQATPAPNAKPQEKPSLDEGDRDDLAKISPASPTADAVNQNRALREEKRKKDAPGTPTDNNLAGGLRAMRKATPLPKSEEKSQSNAGEKRSVGGKTFNNVGGIWFDSAYGKQKQKTVRRGTSEYLRLDSGLRSIADSLGGTVVILWGGKAYRIQ